MKLAINKDGKEIEADAGAPSKAICPYCKGEVILRSRRNSFQPEAITYFWRHDSHANPRCPARKMQFIIYELKPVQRSNPNKESGQVEFE